MMYVTVAPEPKKYAVVSVEIITNQPAITKYFSGYDFMGSVNWVTDWSEAMNLEPEEAEQIVRDLVAAD